MEEVLCTNTVHVMRDGVLTEVAACRRGQEGETTLVCEKVEGCNGSAQVFWNGYNNRAFMHRSARGDLLRINPTAEGVHSAGHDSHGRG